VVHEGFAARLFDINGNAKRLIGTTGAAEPGAFWSANGDSRPSGIGSQTNAKDCRLMTVQSHILPASSGQFSKV
jgi:hypothetical protein